MNSPSLSRCKCFRRNFNILLPRSGQTADGYSFQLSCKGVYTLKVPWGGDRKSCFDDIDSEAHQLMPNLQLLS